MTPESQRSRTKPWTFLVYLAGDNNLSEEMVWSLQEMKKAASAPAVREAMNLLALYDSRSERPRRYDIVRPPDRRGSGGDGDLEEFTEDACVYREADVLRLVRERLARDCMEALEVPVGDGERVADLSRRLLDGGLGSAADVARFFGVEAPGEEALARVEALLRAPRACGFLPVSRNQTVPVLVEDFLAHAIRELPRSDRYAVILSGHGSGAVGDFLTDSDPASALSIPVLGRVLERAVASLGKKIDILGMDSCQMSTIEVGYEVRGVVEHIVASEGLVLNAGWPYHRILEAVGRNPEGSASELASTIAAGYLAFYRDYEVAGLSTDIAATNLSGIERVAGGVKRLAEEMGELLSRLAADGLEEKIELGVLGRSSSDEDVPRARSIRDALVLAHWAAQSYKCDRYVDLFDFCGQLPRFLGGAEASGIRACCTSLREAIAAAVARAGTTGPEFQHSHGLSLYFPWSASDYFPDYRNLSFARETGWDGFLEAYLKATTRSRRFQSTNLEAPSEAGKGLVLDLDGKEAVPAKPIRRPESSLSGTKDVDAGTHRDVDAGTHRDVDAGTHRGKVCRPTMKNPPEGYYRSDRRSG